MSRIFLSPPDINGTDREMLLAAVDSGWVAPVGPDLDAFEHEVAQACGRACGVALASGTAALHLALLEAGVGPGKEVIVPTFTFAATANAVLYCGATPVFVDSDSSNWQLSAELTARALDKRRRAGALIENAVVVDLYGQCADYEALETVFADRGVLYIEDAAEALGATFQGRRAGSFGRSSVVSFNGNKIISSSGGGMLVTDDPSLASRCRYLATQARQPGPHYEHTEVGFNYRLSNLLAAFGRGQLSDLERRVVRRRTINARYREAFDTIDGIGFMPEATYGRSTCWLTCITVDPDVTGRDRDSLRLTLEDRDIESRPTWKPMHLQPLFAGATSFIDGTSDRLFSQGLCLPSGSSLSDADQDRIIDTLMSELGR